MAIVRLSYQELGERLGISAEAARQRAKRRHWQIIPANEPNGRAFVLIDEEALAREAVRPPDDRPDEGGDVRPYVPPEALAALAEQLAGLRAELQARTQDAARVAALEVELAMARAQLAAATAIAEERVRAAQAVAIADAATATKALEGKDALLGELRQELARLRRPWWRRWRG